MQNSSPRLTRTTTFARCSDISEHLFAVRGGLPAQDALEHAAGLFRCAAAIATEAADSSGNNSALNWATVHLIEMGEALLESAMATAEPRSH